VSEDDSRLWAMIHAARRDLAEDLKGVTADDWRRPTLCGDWTVEEVVAHLTAAASIGRWRWIRSMIGAGFRPDVHNDRRLREQLGATPAGTLAKFRGVVDARVAPTGDTAAYLGEVLVHGEDIRRPLNLGGRPDIEALTAVAEFYARRDFTVPSRTLASGLRLEAADGPFGAGAGPRVTGPTLALVMTMAGRREYLDELEGPGRDALAERLAPPVAGS
jgi:uncharacterized protein (TIGR03083 family)